VQITDFHTGVFLSLETFSTIGDVENVENFMSKKPSQPLPFHRFNTVFHIFVPIARRMPSTKPKIHFSVFGKKCGLPKR